MSFTRRLPPLRLVGLASVRATQSRPLRLAPDFSVSDPGRLDVSELDSRVPELVHKPRTAPHVRRRAGRVPATFVAGSSFAPILACRRRPSRHT